MRSISLVSIRYTKGYERKVKMLLPCFCSCPRTVKLTLIRLLLCILRKKVACTLVLQ